LKKREKRKYIFILIFVLCAMIFIGFTLSGFNKEIQQRVYEKQIETMKALSMQGSAVVEKKLEGFINTLFGLAEYLHEEDIIDPSNIDRLKEFMNKKDIGF